MNQVIKSMIAVTCVAGAALVSIPAFAAGEGLYIDASIGRQKASIPSFAITGLTKDDTSSTWSLGGGYQVNQYFGIEVGYQDLGEVSYSWSGEGTVISGANTFVGTGAAKLGADVDGFYFGPTLSFPINEQFSLNARAGWYRWEAKLALSATAAGTLNGTPVAAGASASATGKGTDAYIGIGGTYKLNKNVGINLSYTQYKVDDYKAKNLALGVRYSF